MATVTFHDQAELKKLLKGKLEELARAENAHREAVETKDAMYKAYKQHCTYVETCAMTALKIQNEVNEFEDASMAMSSSHNEVAQKPIIKLRPKMQTSSTHPQEPDTPPPLALLEKWTRPWWEDLVASKKKRRREMHEAS